MTPMPNEKDVLLQITKGDQHAFTRLFDAYYKRLAAYIYRVTESKEVTEEIVQDVFIKVWEKRETLDTIDNFSNFLFTISRNKVLNYLRNLAKMRVHQLSWSREHQEDSYVMDGNSLNDEYNLIIEKAISSLPPQQQKVYILSRYEHLKYEEIAVQMGLSKETVKKHMQLALGFLKEHVKRKIEQALILALLTYPIIF